MNRVIRSPAISQTPVVISVRPAADTALLPGDAEDFREVGPHLDEETGDQLPEDAGTPEDQTGTENDAESGATASASGDETIVDPEGIAPADPPRSPEFGPVPPEPEGEPVGPEGSGPDLHEGLDAQGPPDAQGGTPDAQGGTPDAQGGPPDAQGGTLSEEEGEMMIGLEEVAERDAAAAGAVTASPGVQDPAAETASATADEPLPASASEIEAIVEERLKEFEERFQQEKEDAYHAGFEDGTNEGTKQGLSQSEDEIARFQSAVDTLTEQWKDTLKTYDTAVTDLAIKIAQKIISVEIDHNQDAVLQAVHDCLAYVEDKTKVTIRVNPDDLEAVRRHRNDWLESLESIDHLLIESEPSVSRGGCIVETPIGDVDAQIEERLERLRVVLLEEINRTDTGQET